jgi:hypothetical protein
LAAFPVGAGARGDELAGRWTTAFGLLAGMLLYIGSDAWLVGNEERRAMRHAAHTAMAGQPMTMSPERSEAARVRPSPPGS